MAEESAGLIALRGVTPTVSADAWVAPGVVMTGAVSVASQATVWFGVVARGDIEPISIGERCSVQDGVILHTDAEAPVVLGRDVAIGHRAVVHGCKVGDECLIGIGAVVLSGARLGRGCTIGAGSVVLEGTEVPEGALAVGIPARIVGEATPGMARSICERYVVRAREYQGEVAGPAG